MGPHRGTRAAHRHRRKARAKPSRPTPTPRVPGVQHKIRTTTERTEAMGGVLHAPRKVVSAVTGTSGRLTLERDDMSSDRRVRPACRMSRNRSSTGLCDTRPDLVRRASCPLQGGGRGFETLSAHAQTSSSGPSSTRLKSGGTSDRASRGTALEVSARHILASFADRVPSCGSGRQSRLIQRCRPPSSMDAAFEWPEGERFPIWRQQD